MPVVPTTATAPTTAASPTSTTPASTTVLSPPTTLLAAPTTAGSPPVAVAEVRAGPGGGSGEITVTWRGVLGAASYRVERATAPDGPFTSGGTITPDGRVTRGDGVVNLFAAGDGTFTYVEVIATLSNGGVQRWYRVAATNAAGSTGLSRVVCGAPPGAPAC